MVSSWIAWAFASRAAFDPGLSSFAIAPMTQGPVLMMNVVASKKEMRRRTLCLIMMPNPSNSRAFTTRMRRPSTARRCGHFFLQYQ